MHDDVILLWKENECHLPNLAVVKTESPINITSGQIVASVWVKVLLKDDVKS